MEAHLLGNHFNVPPQVQCLDTLEGEFMSASASVDVGMITVIRQPDGLRPSHQFIAILPLLELTSEITWLHLIPSDF